MINNSNLTLQCFNTYFNTHYNQKSGRVYNFYKLITHYLGSQNRFFSPGFFFEKDLDFENIVVECGRINYVQ